MLKTSALNALSTTSKVKQNSMTDCLRIEAVKSSCDSFVSSNCNSNNKSYQTFLVAFEGLSRAIKQKLYNSDFEIAELVEKYPKSKGVIGSPPAQWIKNIPAQDRSKAIKELYSGIGEAAKVLSVKAYDAGCYRFDKKKMYQDLAPKIALASAQIKEALGDLALNTSDFDFKFVGLGSNGCVYRFNIAEKDYVIKVYHTDHDKRISSKDYHGKFIESNRAAFIKGLNKPSHYANYYFADLNKGFMIADFIDSSSKAPIRKLKEKFFGFFFADNKGDKAEENTLNGWNIDFGGIKIYNQLIAKNKTVRYVCSNITNNASSKEWTANWDKLFDQAKEGSISNKPDILLGLIAFARFLPVKDREERYEKVLDLSSIREIELLVKNIECIPKAYRLEIIKKYINLSDSINPKEIISSLSYLDQDLQLTVLGINSLNKSELVSELKKYPDKTRLELIKILSKDANYVTLDIIKDLETQNPLEIQANMLNLLAKYANREVKAMIFYELRYLPEEIVIDVFKDLIDNSDRDMKKRFLKDLVIIPEALRSEAHSILKSSFS